MIIKFKRIKWMYENFGLVAAIKSAGIDVLALLAFMGFCLTLPYHFVRIMVQNLRRKK